jgi:hypothetical protein
VQPQHSTAQHSAAAPGHFFFKASLLAAGLMEETQSFGASHSALLLLKRSLKQVQWGSHQQTDSALAVVHTHSQERRRTRHKWQACVCVGTAPLLCQHRATAVETDRLTKGPATLIDHYRTTPGTCWLQKQEGPTNPMLHAAHKPDHKHAV